MSGNPHVWFDSVKDQPEYQDPSHPLRLWSSANPTKRICIQDNYVATVGSPCEGCTIVQGSGGGSKALVRTRHFQVIIVR